MSTDVLPSCRGRASQELDEGRFVYWCGTVTSAVALEEPFGG